MSDALDPKLTRRALLSGATAVGVLATVGQDLAAAIGAAIAVPPPAIRPIALPPLALRGYGTLSGLFHPVVRSDGPASMLELDCESTAKALLLQAKYLSDLRSLPCVSSFVLSTPSGPVPAWTVEGNGRIAAFAIDLRVVILAAASEAALRALAVEHVPAGTPSSAFAARTTVPMFLDRFDKHGLLCYYQPLRELPATSGQRTSYSYSEDFAFAAQSQLGLVFWDTETLNDTAEGLANLASWGWAAQESRARGIPMHINISCGPALWLTNRYRYETMQKQPQYCGSDYRIGEAAIGAVGTLSWAAEEAKDVELGVLQDTVRRFVNYPNVVGWLEPHGEADYPPVSLLVEFGGVADRSFRAFLQALYESPAAVAQAWYGDAQALTGWDQVHVPELAAFLGWGPDALDLTGDWKIQFLTAPDGHAYTREEAHRFGGRPTPAAAVPPEWYRPSFADDKWGAIRLPGDDRQMFLIGAPAVVRRVLDVPARWLERYSRQWLYVWDLSEAAGERYPFEVNGRPGELAGNAQPHWGVAEVTGMLVTGENSIAMRLPKGFLGYRCYLAPTPPLQYPALGPLLNARWSDFVGWSRAMRGAAIRRGAEMIRQVDRDRPINFMHPDAYLDLVGSVCADFGGQFHNTGYMAGFWSEYNPIIARSLGRPASAEPGNGAATARDFQAFWGRWLTEGIQSVHYFQHVGDILWNPEVRRTFAANRTLYETIGKYHLPRAEVAVLYGLRSNALTSWPWGLDSNINMPGGYWSFNTAFSLLTLCPRDGVTEESLENGAASKYRVIIDSNTSIMTEAMVAKIAQYVRDGGTFVTFCQTGRHTPRIRDAWPIDELTGYRVVRIDRYGDGNWPQGSRILKLAPAQTVFQAKPWDSGIRGSGLALQPIATEVQDQMLWEDGTVAAGMRPLGSGRVIHLGVMFGPLGDRTDSPLMEALLGQIIEHLQVARVPARATKAMLRHYISNNGLFDLWMLFNDSDQHVTTDLYFVESSAPEVLFEPSTRVRSQVTDKAGVKCLSGLRLGPMETRLFQSPRREFERAPLEWLHLQREWWAGTTPTSERRLPKPIRTQRNSVDFTDDWAFQAIEGLDDVAIANLAAVEFDDGRWERRPLGIWGLPDHAQVRRAMWRRRVTVPTEWQTGETQLWLRSWFSTTFHDLGRVFIDGRLIRAASADGLAGVDARGLLRPGQSHLIAVDIEGSGTLRGVDGSAWLYHFPEPAAKLDLGGSWQMTRDGLHEDGARGLPGAFNALFASRNITVDRGQAHRNVVVFIRADGPVFGVLINGCIICRHHHMIGTSFAIDITPKTQFGADNRLELITRDATQTCHVQAIELRFYDRGAYP